MHFLAKSFYNVISLKEVVNCINENRSFPRKSVAITFDDGFKNNYEIAYPVLKELRFKATIFLVTGYCGGKNDWLGQHTGVPIFDLLEWDQIEEMAENGIDFGAHTVNHPNLLELTLEQVEDEIVCSKKEIEEYLGKNIVCFAFPYGGKTKKFSKILNNEFQCAVTTELKVACLESNIYSLPRIDMYYFSKNNLFTRLDTLHFNSYIKCRRVLRTLRTFLSN